MQSGRFRHLVRILRKKDGRDGHGAPTQAFETFKDAVPADIRSAATMEGTGEQRRVSTATHIVAIRHCQGVETAMRVFWPGENRTFDVAEVKRDRTLRRDMILRCVEREA